jgi:adenylate cyclase
MTTSRRLAAILAADVEGYSRLIGADEERTLNQLRAIRAEVIDPKVSEHHGRIVKTTGDGLLVEFGSVVDALRCATEWQKGMAERDAATPGSRIEFRIGINVGDVVVEGDDIFGDGVNVAARLEAMAEPGGICVSARVQEDAAGRLDLIFEDLGDQNLKHIARPVRVYRVRLAVAENTFKANLIEAGRVLALPDKPSIAVLPFQNMSGDPEQQYFADGMVEEIITALSRIRWLFVIARNSTFTYKGQPVDVKQVGRELGVRYVLEGSVRKGGNRLRITGQLIDAETGVHLWADRFDGSLEDVFELQDRIAVSVAGVIEPTLEAAESRRSASRPTNDLTAYDLYLRALPLHLSFERTRIIEALDLLNQAISRDPRFGPALALAAWCHVQHETFGLTDDVEANRRSGLDLAQRALQVAGDDISVLAPAVFAFARFSGGVHPASVLLSDALERNPSSARGWYVRGWLHLWAGQTAVSIEDFETAARLNPRDQSPFARYGVGVALYFQKNFDEAVANLLVALQQLPNFVGIQRFLAASYAQMGRMDEAREVVERLRTVTPVVTQQVVAHWLDPAYREFLLSGLRLATGETA